MNIIIDANNLCGALDFLSEENFDQKLIDIFIDFNKGKGRKIYLVFDGVEQMGDRMSLENNVEVIYTPRDGYYDSADDKIVELVKLADDKNELLVVSDDIELRERVEKIADNKNNNIILKKASDFVNNLNIDIENSDNNIVSEEDSEKLNDELLKIWGK